MSSTSHLLPEIIFARFLATTQKVNKKMQTHGNPMTRNRKEEGRNPPKSHHLHPLTLMLTWKYVSGRQLLVPPTCPLCANPTIISTDLYAKPFKKKMKKEKRKKKRKGVV